VKLRRGRNTEDHEPIPEPSNDAVEAPEDDDGQDDRDDEHETHEGPQTLEEAHDLIRTLQEQIASLRGEAAARRIQLRELRDAGWRDAAVRAEIRAQAAAQGLREELALRLIDLDGVQGDTPGQLELAVGSVLAKAGDDFPELKRKTDTRPLVTQGGRSGRLPGRQSERSWLRG
jgi:hypothetical protein